MKKKPLWVLILADSLILGAALVVFALFHHVLPHQKTSLGIVSVQPSPQSGTTQAPSSSFSLIGTALAEESVPDTERTLAEDQGLTLSERSCLNGTVQYYLADLNLTDATALKTAFAYDTYGGGFAQTVSEMARQQDALLCVNGDYYGNSDEGVVVRNGVIYRANPTDADILCLYYDGTMAVKSYREFDVQAEAAGGIWQAWTFGPSLLDENGQALSAFHEGRHMNGRNPRTVLGYYGPNHYALLVADGRGRSAGLSLTELSQLCEDLGFQIAYNLDGGKSSVMTYQDAVVNQPAGGGRAISDVIYIGEASL